MIKSDKDFLQMIDNVRKAFLLDFLLSWVVFSLDGTIQKELTKEHCPSLRGSSGGTKRRSGGGNNKTWVAGVKTQSFTAVFLTPSVPFR